MIGKGNHGIHAVAVFRAGLQGPAAEHGDAPGLEAFQQSGPDAVRRGDDDVAGRRVAVELKRFGQSRDAGLAAGAGHGGGGGMEQCGDLVFLQQGERLLGFSERVA